MAIGKSVNTSPFYRADDNKVVTKERALGGHTINWHSAIIMGASGNRLFERSEFPIAAQNDEQRRKSAGGGVIYFGYFLLDKQKKESRQSGETDESSN